MTDSTVMTLAQEAMRILLLVSLPLLLAALISGLLIGIFQAATQINEVTLSFVPKMLAMAATIAIAGNWMIGLLVDYTRRLITELPGMLG